MRTLSDFDNRDALRCANYLFRGLKRGESTICYWVPGAGKSTTLQNLFSSKKLLHKVLGAQYSRFKFLYFRGDESLSGSAKEVLELIYTRQSNHNKYEQSRSTTIESFKTACEYNLNQGKEMVYVGDLLEILPEAELASLLHFLGAVIASNKSRIHVILNSLNRPLLDKIFLNDPVAFGLAQNSEFIPLSIGQDLDLYLQEQQVKLNLKTSVSEIAKIKEYFGGLLYFIVAYLRLKTKLSILKLPEILNQPDINLRVCSIWSRLPCQYQQILENICQKLPITDQFSKQYLADLINFGIIKKTNRELRLVPKIFEMFLPRLQSAKPLKILKKSRVVYQDKLDLRQVLTPQEHRALYILISRQNRIVDRDILGEAIWGAEAEEKYSPWAIDQTISRLRKHLIQLNLPPEIIKTIKGEGYRWEA